MRENISLNRLILVKDRTLDVLHEASGHSFEVQGYLAHKKQHPPARTTKGPWA